MIAIIDYNAGNLTSVARAISHIGFDCKITCDLKEIDDCERIIFPGVGAAGSAMESLKKLGLDLAIKDAFDQGKPILGICLGTQIIMGYSEENDTKCINIIEGTVKRFSSDLILEDNNKIKIPHMGWNSLKVQTDHFLLSSVSKSDEFYFVHGFYPEPANPEHILAVTNYGITFPSVIGFKNIVATQFHLEKSGQIGLALLKKFCEWNPC